MTHHGPIERAANEAHAPVERLVELRAVLTIVERMAGVSVSEDRAADEAALARRFAHAPGVAQSRFETLAREASTCATAGIEALAASGAPNPAAARRLALALRRSLSGMERAIGG